MLPCRSMMSSTSGAVEKPVSAALQAVLHRINKATEQAGRSKLPRLVAVSKTKPVELLMDAYASGQRIFGENYVQELLDKAPSMPSDVQWHLIGHLQSNKVKAVIENVPNLAMVETVDSVKLADRIDRVVGAAGRGPLPVMVQVNTSGEETKFGVEPDEVVELAAHIANKCKNLQLAGFMTIGMPDYTSRPECFERLVESRRKAAAVLSVDPDSLELSMGMSGDFEAAIAMGSTNVRVGSTIFGSRG